MTNNEMIVAIDIVERVANKYIEFYLNKITWEEFVQYAKKEYSLSSDYNEEYIDWWLENNEECRMITSSGGLFESIVDEHFLDHEANERNLCLPQYVIDYWIKKIDPIKAYARNFKSIEKKSN